MLWVVLGLLALAVLTVWVAWTAQRIDRLEARVQTSRAALENQLVRRAAGALAIADADADVLGPQACTALRIVARTALSAPPDLRESAENDLGRALSGIGRVDPVRLAELQDSVTRVAIARRFHNDAVRHLHDLRAQRMPRLLHLGERAPLPGFFEIDDRA